MVMILEIGIDCVEIISFSKNIISKKNVINRIFTKNEIKYCEKKANPSQHYASRFACKEAVIKAFSCYKIKISMNQIEIINKKNRNPFVMILDKTIRDFNIKVSLSHSKQISIAVAVVSKSRL